MSNLLATLKKIIPDYRPSIVFDVGANIGQSIKLFKAEQPDSYVYAFEPVEETFDKLKCETAHMVGINYNNCALGLHTGQAYMTVRGTSTGNQIQPHGSGKFIRDVNICRGDEFCYLNNIKKISFLKVDTEGHDLDVVLGFGSILIENNIDFIQVEASMNSSNKRHVDQSRFHGLLEPIGYSLFRIYDQTFERNLKPVLRRANLVFVSRKFVNDYHRRK